MNHKIVFRTEKKYYIDLSKRYELMSKLQILCKEDIHNKDGGYLVESIYFDSIDNCDFREKIAGVKDRKKIRIRKYDGNDDFFKLEMKKKDGDSQYKISLPISNEIYNNLLEGRYEVLLGCTENYDTALNFYNIMQLGLYRPVAFVSYKRKAYIYEANDVRLTFDSNIKGCEIIDKKNMNMNLMPLMEEFVFEVKYNKKMPDYISDILKRYSLEQLSLSKYCMSRMNYYYYL